MTSEGTKRGTPSDSAHQVEERHHVTVTSEAFGRGWLYMASCSCGWRSSVEDYYSEATYLGAIHLEKAAKE